jgi:DNA-binding phage protein
MKNKLNAVSLVSRGKEEAYFKKVMKHAEAQEAYNEAEAFYNFVEQIKLIMAKRHLTYYSVAKKAGMRHQVLARILNGSKNAELSSLSKVAHGVGARLDLNLVFEKR